MGGGSDSKGAGGTSSSQIKDDSGIGVIETGASRLNQRKMLGGGNRPPTGGRVQTPDEQQRPGTGPNAPKPLKKEQPARSTHTIHSDEDEFFERDGDIGDLLENKDFKKN
jgi:hypothetical protein